MTVETTTARVTYTGAGTTGPFSVPFYFLEDDDLTVIKTTIADGTETTLVLTTDYVVSGAADEAGGSVTLTASLSSAYKLTIIRDPDLLQGSDYPPNDKFPATTHERVVDKLTMIAQRLKDLINRSFRLSDGDVSGISLSLSNLSASKLIAVNSAGTALEAVAAADVGLTPVSDFAATLLDDADADAARTTLGAASLGANTFTGLQTWKASSDIASGATVDLGTATGNSVIVTHSTGTTAITSLGGASLPAGTEIETIFSISGGTLTITHHPTNLYLAGGANITLANGDTIRWKKMHDSNAEWKMVGGVKADGTAWVTSGNVKLAGDTVQVIEATPYTTYSSTATAIPFDDTIPQKTEGAEWNTVTITPTNASNRLVIEASFSQLAASSAVVTVAALFQDSAANALVSATAQPTGADYNFNLSVRHEMAAGTTSATTFKVRAGPDSGTLYINGRSTGRLYGGTSAVRIKVTEIQV